MTQQQIKNSFFISLSLLIFFADLALFALLQQHLILPLHCWIIKLMAEQQQNRIILPALLLLCILSYLDTNVFGSCLMYMLPTWYFAKYCKEHLQIKFIIPYLLLIASLCTKTGILKIMHLTHISWYTFIISLCYNCLCLAIFIKIYGYGKQKYIEQK